MAILGAVITIIFIVGSILTAGSISSFIDIPSILTVAGPAIGAVLAKHGTNGFKLIFNPEEGEEVYRTVGFSALFSGVIGSLIGFVIMLGNLSDIAALGPALAVIMLTSLYGLIVFLICWIMSKSNKMNSITALVPFFFLGVSLISFGLVMFAFQLKA